MVQLLIARLKDFARDDKGASAIEYAIIAVGILLAIIPPIHIIASKMM